MRIRLTTLMFLVLATASVSWAVIATRQSDPTNRWRNDLRSGSAHVRLMAAELRGEHRPNDGPAEVAGLIGALGDPAIAVRVQAALSLGGVVRLHGPNALGPAADDAATALLGSLADRQPKVQAAAAEALAATFPGHPDAVVALVELAKPHGSAGARSSEVRAAALGSLATVDLNALQRPLRERVRRAILDGLADPDPTIRRAILARISGTGMGDDPAIFAAIVSQIDGPSGLTREPARDALLRVEQPPATAVQLLVKLVDGRDAIVRNRAISALERIGLPARRAAPDLLRVLRSTRSTATQIAAGRAIAAVSPGGPEAAEAVQVLATILHESGSWPARRSAGLTLARFGKGAAPAREALRAAMSEDPAPPVREASAAVLSRLDAAVGSPAPPSQPGGQAASRVMIPSR